MLTEEKIKDFLKKELHCGYKNKKVSDKTLFNSFKLYFKTIASSCNMNIPGRKSINSRYYEYIAKNKDNVKVMDECVDIIYVNT